MQRKRQGQSEETKKEEREKAREGMQATREGQSEERQEEEREKARERINKRRQHQTEEERMQDTDSFKERMKRLRSERKQQQEHCTEETDDAEANGNASNETKPTHHFLSAVSAETRNDVLADRYIIMYGT